MNFSPCAAQKRYPGRQLLCNRVDLSPREAEIVDQTQPVEVTEQGEPRFFVGANDVHMGRIRAAIEVDPKAPKRILTVRGVGYVFARQQD